MIQGTNPFTPQALMTFTASLGNLPVEEARKAKRLYILDALTTYETMLRSLQAFGCLQMFFGLIPIFWPILLLQWVSMRASQEGARQMIRNALDVWRDDLGDEHDRLADRLDQLRPAAWVGPLPAIGFALVVWLTACISLGWLGWFFRPQ